MTNDTIRSGDLLRHYFQRAFKSQNETNLSGYLTFTISENNFTRNILLVNDIKELVPTKLTNEYKKFCNWLENNYKFNKSVKSNIDSIDFTNVIIAVHKSGPVPVFDTTQTINVELNGKTIEAKIVVLYCPKFKNWTQLNNQLDNHSYLTNIDENLNLIFKRYYEDITSRLLDIVNNANKINTAKWAKDIESIIAGSIKNKLDKITPSKSQKKGGFNQWKLWKTNYSKLDSLQKIKADFFFNNRYAIYSASYFRLVTLYLINCLYANIGISSRRSYYKKRINKEMNLFEEYFGEGFSQRVPITLPDIFDLSHYIKAFNENNKLDIMLNKTQNGEYWVKCIIPFIRHLYWLKKCNVSPHKGNLFISYHHDVPVAETIKGQVYNYLKEMKNAKVVPLCVTGQEYPNYFREKIKALIWHSDKITSVLPGVPTKNGTKKNKSYKWIARESEYAVLHDKNIIFMKMEGVTDKDYESIFFNPDYGFLELDNRLKNSIRLQRLHYEWKENTHTKFKVSSTNIASKNLDPRVSKRLDFEVKEILNQKPLEILKSYFEQFPPHILFILKEIYIFFPENTFIQKKEIIKIINKSCPNLMKKLMKKGRFYSSVDSLVSDFINHFKRRKIEINNYSYSLLIYENRTYSLNLSRIFNALDSSLNKDEIKLKISKLLVH